MATDISTISNDSVKVRFQEPYVSQGLNKKLVGLMPPGIVRGGTLTTSATAMAVTVQDDDKFGDSVYSYIDSNGHQLTVRQSGDITLDLTAFASTTIFIGLEVTYTTSSATSAKWRAYNQSEIDADSSLIVIGKVVVPASGTISASAITLEERRIAWQNKATGLSTPRQIIKNGDFALAGAGTITTGELDWAFWETDAAVETGLTFEVDSVVSQEGDQSLKINLTGAAGQNGALAQEGMIAVKGGQVIDVRFWLSTTSLSPGPGSSGHMGVRILGYTENPSLGTQIAYADADLTLTGTNAFAEFSKSIKLDSDVRWIRIYVYYDDDSQSSTGSINIDGIRVFVEQPSDATDGPVEDLQDSLSSGVVTRSLGIGKNPNDASSMADYIQKILDLRYDTSNEFKMQLRDTTEFLLKLLNGNLNIENQLKIGDNLEGSAANAAEPRIEVDVPSVGSPYFTLFFEGNETTPAYGNIRIYIGKKVTTGAGSSYESRLVITLNARWTGTQWERDVNTVDSTRYDFGRLSFNYYFRDDAETDTWSDEDWETTETDAPFEVRVSGGMDAENVSVEMNDGVIDFKGCTTGSASNPARTTYTKNRLYAKSTIKFFGYFNTTGTGGGGTVDYYECFNIASVDINSYSIDINFQQAFGSKEDYAYSAIIYVSGALDGFCTPYYTSSSGAFARIIPLEHDGTGLDPSAAAVSIDWMVIGCGRYND